MSALLNDVSATELDISLLESDGFKTSNVHNNEDLDDSKNNFDDNPKTPLNRSVNSNRSEDSIFLTPFQEVSMVSNSNINTNHHLNNTAAKLDQPHMSIIQNALSDFPPKRTPINDNNTSYTTYNMSSMKGEIENNVNMNLNSINGLTTTTSYNTEFSNESATSMNSINNEAQLSLIDQLTNEKEALIKDLEQERNQWSTLYDTQMNQLRQEHAKQMEQYNLQVRSLTKQTTDLTLHVEELQLVIERNGRDKEMYQTDRLEEVNRLRRRCERAERHVEEREERMEMMNADLLSLKAKLQASKSENAQLTTLLLSVQAKRRYNLKRLMRHQENNSNNYSRSRIDLQHEQEQDNGYFSDPEDLRITAAQFSTTGTNTDVQINDNNDSQKNKSVNDIAVGTSPSSKGSGVNREIQTEVRVVRRRRLSKSSTTSSSSSHSYLDLDSRSDAGEGGGEKRNIKINEKQKSTDEYLSNSNTNNKTPNLNVKNNKDLQLGVGVSEERDLHDHNNGHASPLSSAPVESVHVLSPYIDAGSRTPVRASQSSLMSTPIRSNERERRKRRERIANSIDKSKFNLDVGEDGDVDNSTGSGRNRQTLCRSPSHSNKSRSPSRSLKTNKSKTRTLNTNISNARDGDRSLDTTISITPPRYSLDWRNSSLKRTEEKKSTQLDTVGKELQATMGTLGTNEATTMLSSMRKQLHRQKRMSDMDADTDTDTDPDMHTNVRTDRILLSPTHKEVPMDSPNLNTSDEYSRSLRDKMNAEKVSPHNINNISTTHDHSNTSRGEQMVQVEQEQEISTATIDAKLDRDLSQSVESPFTLDAILGDSRRRDRDAWDGDNAPPLPSSTYSSSSAPLPLRLQRVGVRPRRLELTGADGKDETIHGCYDHHMDVNTDTKAYSTANNRAYDMHTDDDYLQGSRFLGRLVKTDLSNISLTNDNVTNIDGVADDNDVDILISSDQDKGVLSGSNNEVIIEARRRARIATIATSTAAPAVPDGSYPHHGSSSSISRSPSRRSSFGGTGTDTDAVLDIASDDEGVEEFAAVLDNSRGQEGKRRRSRLLTSNTKTKTKNRVNKELTMKKVKASFGSTKESNHSKAIHTVKDEGIEQLNSGNKNDGNQIVDRRLYDYNYNFYEDRYEIVPASYRDGRSDSGSDDDVNDGADSLGIDLEHFNRYLSGDIEGPMATNFNREEDIEMVAPYNGSVTAVNSRKSTSYNPAKQDSDSEDSDPTLTATLAQLVEILGTSNKDGVNRDSMEVHMENIESVIGSDDDTEGRIGINLDGNHITQGNSDIGATKSRVRNRSGFRTQPPLPMSINSLGSSSLNKDLEIEVENSSMSMSQSHPSISLLSPHHHMSQYNNDGDYNLQKHYRDTLIGFPNRSGVEEESIIRSHPPKTISPSTTTLEESVSGPHKITLFGKERNNGYKSISQNNKPAQGTRKTPSRNTHSSTTKSDKSTRVTSKSSVTTASSRVSSTPTRSSSKTRHHASAGNSISSQSRQGSSRSLSRSSLSAPLSTSRTRSNRTVVDHRGDARSTSHSGRGGVTTTSVSVKIPMTTVATTASFKSDKKHEIASSEVAARKRMTLKSADGKAVGPRRVFASRASRGDTRLTPSRVTVKSALKTVQSNNGNTNKNKLNSKREKDEDKSLHATVAATHLTTPYGVLKYDAPPRVFRSPRTLTPSPASMSISASRSKLGTIGRSPSTVVKNTNRISNVNGNTSSLNSKTRRKGGSSPSPSRSLLGTTKAFTYHSDGRPLSSGVAPPNPELPLRSGTGLSSKWKQINVLRSAWSSSPEMTR